MMRPMTVISRDLKVVTFINVFTVDPENQQRLVDLLTKVTEGSAEDPTDLDRLFRGDVIKAPR